jgi:hypothetical protein
MTNEEIDRVIELTKKDLLGEGEKALRALSPEGRQQVVARSKELGDAGARQKLQEMIDDGTRDKINAMIAEDEAKKNAKRR